jgi:hypothetical protein
VAEGSGRSLLATLVGYVIVAIIVIWLLGAVVGIVVWLLRSIIAVAVVIGLILLYLKLKSPPDDV